MDLVHGDTEQNGVEEVKPCFVCDSHDNVWRMFDGETVKIHCYKCHMRSVGLTEAEATKDWNDAYENRHKPEYVALAQQALDYLRQSEGQGR